MARFLQIIVFISTAILLISCNTPSKEKPIWEQVKIRDLRSLSDADSPADRLLKTINLDIHIFEIPGEDANTLNVVWQMMYAKPLQFNDFDAFKANSFSVGFGQIQMWDTIANVLRDAGGKQIETVSLLLPDGETSDFPVARLNSEHTVFYISSGGSMEGATIGPGRLALRIKVEKILGSRGVCKVTALPVFPSLMTSPIPQLAEQAKSAEFLFTSAGFSLKMSPGDFVLLGPQKYIGHQITLGSLFFSRPKPRPTVRLFLIICTRIID
ncbi:MAG: hypothetical protein JW947_06530 [Sedimentisphaerales bacterium]|nr:hypothetical protein [Sedimentisphaerales bacterium]